MVSNKIIMIVAGSDCSGGAGLAADIGMVRLLQCYPMPVVSCITSQGPGGFRMMQAADLDIFADQLKAVLSNVRPDAVKIGMLPSARHMEVLMLMLGQYDHGPVVFDPVMSPTDGKENFHAGWQDDLATLAAFMGKVDLITPNLPELRHLVEPLKRNNLLPIDHEIEGLEGEFSKCIVDMHIVRTIYNLKNILLTGGHNEENQFTDILMRYAEEDPDDTEATPKEDSLLFEDHQYVVKKIHTEDQGDLTARYRIDVMGGTGIDTPNTHGTGCIYSSAIATLLGQGVSVQMAVALAKRLILMLLDSGKDFRLFRSGHGPAFSILRMPGNGGDDDNDSNPTMTSGFDMPEILN